MTNTIMLFLVSLKKPNNKIKLRDDRQFKVKNRISAIKETELIRTNEVNVRLQIFIFIFC